LNWQKQKNWILASYALYCVLHRPMASSINMCLFGTVFSWKCPFTEKTFCECCVGSRWFVLRLVERTIETIRSMGGHIFYLPILFASQQSRYFSTLNVWRRYFCTLKFGGGIFLHWKFGGGSLVTERLETVLLTDSLEAVFINTESWERYFSTLKT
jgi:hypothetical protein